MTPLISPRSALRRASAMSSAGRLIPAFTPASTTGLPPNRAFSRTSTSCAQMTASAAAITAGSSRSKPADPWVSTSRTTPWARAAASSDSAAMYVCAIPVGQDVTATMRNGSAVSFSASVSSGAGTAAGTSSPRIRAAAAAGSPSARRAPVNPGSMSRRARLDRMVRWSSSAPAGAAIRKTRSAGPSAAPKSMPAALRPKASVGSLTCSLRQCGMPMPPSRPVGIWASRAATSARKPSRSVTRPASTIRPARERAAALFVSAERSRSTSSAVMSSLIAGLLARGPPGDGAGDGGVVRLDRNEGVMRPAP